MQNRSRSFGLGTFIVLMLIVITIVGAFYIGFWGSEETQTISIVPTQPAGQ